jgi:hypothetical protein
MYVRSMLAAPYLETESGSSGTGPCIPTLIRTQIFSSQKFSASSPSPHNYESTLLKPSLPTDLRAMPRRTHKKSRNGCFECKRRHMKVRHPEMCHVQLLTAVSVMRKSPSVQIVSVRSGTANLWKLRRSQKPHIAPVERLHLLHQPYPLLHRSLIIHLRMVPLVCFTWSFSIIHLQKPSNQYMGQLPYLVFPFKRC